jgi:nitrogen fixation protein FixH
MNSTQSLSTRPTTQTRAELIQAERRARHIWVTIVVGLLSLQVAGGITSVLLAVGDPSAAITPHYHESALNWDTTRRARQLSQQLGWRIKYSVDALADDSRTREFRVEVVDQEGAAIEDLHLTAELFHHALGKEVHRVRFVEVLPGVYATDVAIAKAGIWQAELRLEGAHGIAAESQELTVK